MGNTVCKKCGINHSYYKPYIMNYGILNDRNNCRYHSNVEDKICKRCSKNVLHENCYHEWEYRFLYCIKI